MYSLLIRLAHQTLILSSLVSWAQVSAGARAAVCDAEGCGGTRRLGTGEAVPACRWAHQTLILRGWWRARRYLPVRELPYVTRKDVGDTATGHWGSTPNPDSEG